jgi:hypothetical protein
MGKNDDLDETLGRRMEEVNLKVCDRTRQGRLAAAPTFCSNILPVVYKVLVLPDTI